MYLILKNAIEANASDIHITENKEGWIRAKGKLFTYGEKITASDINEFIEIVIPEMLDKYKMLRDGRSKEPIDGAFFYMSRRFRINIYRSIDGINLAIRLLSDRILSLDELYLPKELAQFTNIKTGLFLVVGTTGSGKSTTLASMIDCINRSRNENILTIEHPIEYIHKPVKSRIVQEEVGIHVESFETATVSAMRQDPNIILVGEMRDLETIQNTISLAVTGHAVYATLHAKSVTETVDRIIDVFPSKQQEQIRLQFAGVLKGIMHQNLIRGTGGILVPLIELLAADDVVAAMILGKQKSNSIRDYMRGKSSKGNVHIADNAAWHIQNGRLKLEDIKLLLAPDDYEIVRALTSSERKRGFSG